MQRPKLGSNLIQKATAFPIYFKLISTRTTIRRYLNLLRCLISLHSFLSNIFAYYQSKTTLLYMVKNVFPLTLPTIILKVIFIAIFEQALLKSRFLSCIIYRKNKNKMFCLVQTYLPYSFKNVC